MRTKIVAIMLCLISFSLVGCISDMPMGLPAPPVIQFYQPYHYIPDHYYHHDYHHYDHHQHHHHHRGHHCH